MSMNDEQFEEAMKAFDDFFITNMTADLRARDTAQREALARVEAENAEIRLAFGGQQMTLDECQAQLAEALGLLRYAVESSSFREILTLERDIAAFLARHAQGEQQEAQSPMAKMAEALRQKAAGEWANHPSNPANQESHGAQDGDELDAIAEAIFNADKDNWYSAGPYPQLHANDKARLRAMARAALATQPAAGEPQTADFPVAIQARFPGGAWTIYHLGDAPELKSAGMEVRGLYPAPPAAAHGGDAELPERYPCTNGTWGDMGDAYSAGWNDCLDRVAAMRGAEHE